jgi:type I restriction enzyme, S subunit
MGSTQVPEGYKQTEVGVIPKDWKINRLDNLTQPQRPISYGIVQTGKQIPNGVGCIRVVDINDGGINDQNLITTSQAISDSYKRTILTSGDLIIALRGKIGELAVVPEKLNNTNLTRGVALIALKDNYLSNFYRQYLSSSNSKIRLQNSLNGSALQELPIATLRSFIVALPPLPEQRSIAQALSDVDALIAALDKLIAKKCHLKTATMQQLLTGKMRLAGFNERWSSYTILEICKNIIDYRGRTPKKLGMEWGNGDIPALSANNVKMGFIDFRAESYFASNNLYQKWMQSGNPRKGDIVLTMEAPLGNVALIPDERKYILSQRVILLQTHETHIYNDFLLQMMMSEKFHFLLSQDSSGTTATGIQRKKLEKISLLLPQLDEQIAIAQVLSDMDAEITALENRRAKNQAIKQGMMQELLTGRTRLV